MLKFQNYYFPLYWHLNCCHSSTLLIWKNTLVFVLSILIAPLYADSNATQVDQKIFLQQQNKLLERVQQNLLCGYDCPRELEVMNLFDNESREFHRSGWLFNSLTYGPDVCQAVISSDPIHNFRQSEVDFIIELNCKTTSAEWKEQMLVALNRSDPTGNLKLIGLCEKDTCRFNYYNLEFAEEYDASQCPHYKSQSTYQRKKQLNDYEDQDLLNLVRKYKGRYFVSDHLINTMANELNAIKTYHTKVDPQGYPGNGYNSNVPDINVVIGSFSVRLKPSFFDYFDSGLPHSIQCINNFWNFRWTSIIMLKGTFFWSYFLQVNNFTDGRYLIEFSDLPFVKKLPHSTGASTYSCSEGVNVFDYSPTERLYLFKGKWEECPLGCSDRTFDEFLVNHEGELTYLGLRKPKTKGDFEFVQMDQCESIPYKLDPDYFDYRKSE